MEIQFLGCGDAFHSGARNHTCFYVTLPKYRFLIDCGATSLQLLKQYQITTDNFDAIILSHFHGDHFGGIPYLLIDAQHIAKRTMPLVIMGPAGVEQKVKQLMQLTYPGTDYGQFNYQIIFREYNTKGAFDLGPLTIHAFKMVHVPEASPHGFRVAYSDKILAFSGDTGWTENLIPLAEGADLFICECNFYETVLPSHLSYKRLLEEGHRLEAKHMVLTHLGPGMLARLDELEIECATEGQKIVL